MVLQKAIDEVADSDNLMNAAAVTAGFIMSQQVFRRIHNALGERLGVDLIMKPSELDGIVTAAVFYGYGDKVMNQSTADMVATGGLVDSFDKLADRTGVKEFGGDIL